jgi:hypothetical protein
MIDDFKLRCRVNPKEDAARAAAEKANLAKQAASKSATSGSTTAAVPLGAARSAQQPTQTSSYGASLFPYGGGAPGAVSAASTSAAAAASAAAGSSRNSRWASAAASSSSAAAPIAPSVPSVIGYDVNWGTSAFGQPYSHPSSQTPIGQSDWRSSASQVQPQIMQQNLVYGSYAPMQQAQHQQYPYQGGAPFNQGQPLWQTQQNHQQMQMNQQQMQQQQQQQQYPGYGIPQQQQQRGGSGRY